MLLQERLALTVAPPSACTPSAVEAACCTAPLWEVRGFLQKPNTFNLVSFQVHLEEAQEEELITVDAVGCFEEEEEQGVEKEMDVAEEGEDAGTEESKEEASEVTTGHSVIFK